MLEDQVNWLDEQKQNEGSAGAGIDLVKTSHEILIPNAAILLMLVGIVGMTELLLDSEFYQVAETIS